MIKVGYIESSVWIAAFLKKRFIDEVIFVVFEVVSILEWDWKTRGNSSFSTGYLSFVAFAITLLLKNKKP